MHWNTISCLSYKLFSYGKIAIAVDAKTSYSLFIQTFFFVIALLFYYENVFISFFLKKVFNVANAATKFLL